MDQIHRGDALRVHHDRRDRHDHLFLHVRHGRDRHDHLFLHVRHGRDRHDHLFSHVRLLSLIHI